MITDDLKWKRRPDGVYVLQVRWMEFEIRPWRLSPSGKVWHVFYRRMGAGPWGSSEWKPVGSGLPCRTLSHAKEATYIFATEKFKRVLAEKEKAGGAS